MTQSYSNTADQLDAVHMLSEDRELAKRQLRSIERTLDAIWSIMGPSRGPRLKKPVAAF